MRLIPGLSVLFFHSLVVALALDQSPLQKSDSSSPLDSNFDTLIERLREDWHVPGLSVAVVKDREVFAKGYGIARFPDTLATPNTLYYGGSTTKAFTAAALSLLVDNGSLEWTTPISTIIRDDFVLSSPHDTSHTTIEDALSHRTGMPRHDLSYGGPNSTTQQIVRSMRHLPLSAEPRTTWQYCNIMYTTAGYVIESLTSTPLGIFLRTKIWEPLKMTSTFFSPSDALSAEHGTTLLAHGYLWHEQSQSYSTLPWLDLSTNVGGAGLIISSVNDYAKWLSALIHSEGPLSTGAFFELTRPRMITPPDQLLSSRFSTVLYALGWEVTTYRGEQLIFHGGSVTGFECLVAFLPARKFGVVMMGNSDRSTPIHITGAFHLVDQLLETPEEDQVDWPSLLREGERQQREKVKDAVERLYPERPKKSIEPTLDFHSYTGTYTHPAYQSLTLTRANVTSAPSGTVSRKRWYDPFSSSSSSSHSPTSPISSEKEEEDYCSSAPLQAHLIRTWAFDLCLQHVSGEFWLGYIRSEAREVAGDVVRAEFEIGADGRVKRIGVEFEPSLKGEKIWFDRVED